MYHFSIYVKLLSAILLVYQSHSILLKRYDYIKQHLVIPHIINVTEHIVSLKITTYNNITLIFMFTNTN